MILCVPAYFIKYHINLIDTTVRILPISIAEMVSGFLECIIDVSKLVMQENQQ